MRKKSTVVAAGIVLFAGMSFAGEWTAQLTDPLEWLYPDSKVGSVGSFLEADVPINGAVEVNVLVNGLDPEKPVTLSAGKAGGRWYRLVDVPVEKNTSIEDWCERPKEKKNPYVTRRAPFRVYDAMEPIPGKLEKAGASTCAFTWYVNAIRLPRKDVCKIVFKVAQDGVEKELPFELRIHPVQLPEPNRSKFRYTNWMRIGSIGSDHGLKDWSKEYYDMLGSYCHLAVRGRQNVAWIPLWAMLERDKETGRYTACEDRFRELVRVYNDCNIRWIEGGHICAAGWGSTNVTVSMTGRTVVSDEGKRDLAEICAEIMRLVRKYGLEDRWLQHVADEPTTKEAARRFRIACDEIHKNMPGIPLLDAVCTPELGDALDIYVPNVNIWQPNRKTYDDLAARGKEIWTYVCLTPGGKWMNRLMDGELVRPALIPWADSLFGIRGFLHWGYNFFNPGQEGGLKFSCYQATPKSNFAPAGDNHLVYAGKNGPWPSRRMEATRQGLEDYEMLEEIRRKDPAKADAIIRQMVTSFDDYRTDLVLYRRLRREILENAVKSDYPHTRLPTERQPVPEAVAADGLGVWTADSMRRVTPMTFPTKAELAAPAVDLSVARHERESAQICLTAGAAKEWKDVSVELPVLKDADGNVLNGRVMWERVGYIPRMPGHLPHWHSVPPSEKWLPDPLLPAAPMRVRAGSTQGAWLTFYAAPEARPGLYTGTAQVVAEGRRIPVRIRLHVRPVTLPKTFSTWNTFALMDSFLRMKYPDRFKEMRRSAVCQMLDHRLSPDDISRTKPPAIDELLFARERGMNRFTLLNVVPVRDDKAGPALVADEKDVASETFRKAFLGRVDAAMAELKKHGLDKMAFLYGFDEREKDQYPAMDKVWRAVHAKYPDLPLMTTCRGFHDKIANPTNPPPFWDSCDWFCPVTDHWNAELAAELRKAGKKTWWYTCCGPDYPYANFASYENPPVEGRVLLGWMTHLYRADGFLFWLVNRWFEKNPLLDESADTYFPEWNTEGVMRCNGDGVLLYPGKDRVLASIRLANVRDGIEDGELLRKVAAWGGSAAAADAYCRELVTDLTHFSRDPAAVRAAREKVLYHAGVIDDFLAAEKTVVYNEAKARTDYALEDPLAFADGRKVRNPKDWPARRREILDLFAKEMYGAEPPKPEDVITEVLEKGKTCGGLATRTQLRMWFRKDKSGPYIDWLLVRPDLVKEPVPVIVQLNYYGNQEVLTEKEVLLPDASLFRRSKDPESYRGNARRSSAVDIVPMEILCARGYAYLTACYEQGAPDTVPIKGDPEELAYTRLFELWGPRDPSRTDNITALGAWAWMLSRGVDYAERDPGLDARRVAVTGCSRLAKAALLAGARDERIAVTVPNQTGGGGAPLSKRVFGENVATEMVQFPHWYCRAYAKYANNEKAMPFDQHLLLACVAPRRLLIEGFTRPWFDCKGEYLACAAAAPVWKFLGKETMPDGRGQPALYSTAAVGGDFGYVCRDGGHGVSGYDWCWLLDFCDRTFKAR